MAKRPRNGKNGRRRDKRKRQAEGNLVRPFQRTVTALFPHYWNRDFIVPKRGKPS